MRLILAKSLLMTQGATFFRVYELQLHRNTRPSKPVTAPRPSARHTRQTRPRASSTQPRRRPRDDRKGVKGLLQHAAPAQSPGSSSPRGVLVTLRTLSDGRRERARGLALSRPSSLFSPRGLRLGPGDPERHSPPPRAPTPSGARAQRRAAGRGREGRAGVRPCVRLRQRARLRERARGKGGSGRGGSASCGYVAELVGSGFSFAATAAAWSGVSVRERDCPHVRRAPSTAELARSPVGASRPSSPEGGGEAILSRSTPRNRAERLGEAAEPRSPPSEAPDAATVGASSTRPFVGRRRPLESSFFPRFPGTPA